MAVALRVSAPEVVDDVGGVEVAVVGQVDDVAHGGVALAGVDLAEPSWLSEFFGSSGSKSSRTSRRSPMRATSARTFLLISEGSISMWIFFALGA